MRVTNQAYDKYNQATPQGQVVKAVPRHKFTFTASLSYLDPNGGLKTLPLDKIINIQMPSWTSSAITMNAYNRKRIVQTNYEYSPITMIAYDTHSPSVLQDFLKTYSNYYFAGPMNESYTEFLTSDKGFKLQSNRNYIRTLDILRQDGQSTNKIQFIIPLLQA